MMKKTILIIEDEAAIRAMINFALAASNFNLLEAGSVREAQQHLARQIPDLILLDWMLPATSGIDYAKQLKKDTKTRDILIIMLTARAEEENKVKGLETGVDDYITKPFSPRELIARIKAVLRRGPLVSTEGLIQVDCLAVDTNQHIVKIHGEQLPLTPIEYRLLFFLLSHANRVHSREHLLNHVWGGENYIDERTVDVHIRRLRNRLKPYHCEDFIHTVRGVGYQFKGRKNLKE